MDALEPRPWIVVAAFNEERRIGQTLDELLAAYENVVVVDDGSSDATAKMVRARRAWLVRHPVNLGQGAALQTGIDFALGQGAELLVTFDADGQHRVSEIDDILRPLRAGLAQFALGSRFLGSAPGIPRVRSALLRAAVRMTRLTTGMRLTDTHNGFRGMTRVGAEAIHIDMYRMEHASQFLRQIANSRLPWVEVPVTIHYTTETLAKGQRSSDALGILMRMLLNRIAR